MSTPLQKAIDQLIITTPAHTPWTASDIHEKGIAPIDESIAAILNAVVGKEIGEIPTSISGLQCKSAPEKIGADGDIVKPTTDQPVTLTYRNWRGEVAERTIIPGKVWFGSTDWHPEPQWLLTAFDVDKDADRDFALKDFGHPIVPPIRLTFPILGSNGARIDLKLVLDHGEQAKRNHYQSVDRLAERGGLSWCELHAVLHNRSFVKMEQNDAMIACRALEARYLRAVANTPAQIGGAA